MSIKKLDPIVASRIAAGEVVERPASVLRELLDNSIDAGATRISVYIEEGGIKSLTVTDNGCGIPKEDLPLACVSHATSKISTLDDLFSLKTLGFRGEALCSIASVSRLTISSDGVSLTTDNGVQGNILPGSVTEGTVISMENLFENIPARKQFLKRPSAEAAECRRVFTEKALGFENTEFLFFNNGELEAHLPAASKKERALTILSRDKNFIAADAVEMFTEEDPVKLYAVSSGPDCWKRDRTQIKIFMNNRVIDCFPLVQVITNAYSVSLPGGAFPYFYLYIEDSPSLVDFNIHPAKRECKIRNQSIISSLLTSMIRETLLRRSRAETEKIRSGFRGGELFDRRTAGSAAEMNSAAETRSTPGFQYTPGSQYTHGFQHSSPAYGKPSGTPSFSYRQAAENRTGSFKEHEVRETSPRFNPSWFESAKAVLGKNTQPADTVLSEPHAAGSTAGEQEAPAYTYIGQAFNTFLIVETGDSLLFIDQHAAHERILYDELTALKDIQRLMVPYRFETDRSTDDFLLENSVIYQDFGVELVRVEPMLWEMTSVPAACRKQEKEIAEYIKNASGDIEGARKGLFAVIACHAAIKAGDVLDTNTAKALLEKVFRLEAMLCPHGRSFVYSISKKKLFEEVGRLV